MEAIPISNALAKSHFLEPDNSIRTPQKKGDQSNGREIGPDNEKGNLGITYPDPIPEFSDVSTGHWANNYVLYVRNAGYMNGVSENVFKPSGVLTKGEIIILVYTDYYYDDTETMGVDLYIYYLDREEDNLQ